MTEATLFLPGLSPIGGKDITATFDGGHLSSDGGVLILREMQQQRGWVTVIQFGWAVESGSVTELGGCSLAWGGVILSGAVAPPTVYQAW